jgi:hypothetical protein
MYQMDMNYFKEELVHAIRVDIAGELEAIFYMMLMKKQPMILGSFRSRAASKPLSV